jgi:N-acetylmuramoyl-L-alanine amidase
MIKRREFIIGCGMAAASANAAVVKRQLPPVDMDFVSEKMTFLDRSEWTSQEVKAWRMRGIGLVDRVTIHHTAGGEDVSVKKEDVILSLQGVLAGHTERGYGDVGYHLIIDYAGRVWAGRSLAYEGAHVKDQNERNVGIMLLGNFEIQSPSEAQIESMNLLVNLVRERYRIKKHRIYGHRDLGSSACPGEKLYAFVQQMKKGEL